MANPIPTTLKLAPRKLLIASLGNPGALYNTLHSAGHHVLDGLQLYLQYPSFTPSRAHGSGEISRGHDALLYKSTTYMNTSGPALATAWRTFLRDLPGSDETGVGGAGYAAVGEDQTAVAALAAAVPARQRARLVIIHDELELELGKVKTRKPGGSLKGHNGLKSVQGTAAGSTSSKDGSSSSTGQAKFWRIGVGIGRPAGRERGEVSDYVLRKMSSVERERIERSVVIVAEELAKLRDEP